MYNQPFFVLCTGVKRSLSTVNGRTVTGSYVRPWRRRLHRLCPSSRVTNHKTPRRWEQPHVSGPTAEVSAALPARGRWQKNCVLPCLLLQELSNIRTYTDDTMWQPVPQTFAPNVIRTGLFACKSHVHGRTWLSRNSRNRCWNPIWQFTWRILIWFTIRNSVQDCRQNE